MFKFTLMTLLLNTLVFATNSNTNIDCKLQVTILYPSSSDIKIVITHDSNCTVSVEDLNQSINSKEHNISQREQKQTQKSKIDKMIFLAKSKIGSPYKYADKGPNSFDCSGFVYYLHKEHNISIPRTSRNQAKTTKKLKREEIQIGDILAFDTSKKGHVNHTGIYIGDSKFIHATSGKAYSVTTSKLDTGFYKDKFKWGIRKIKVF